MPSSLRLSHLYAPSQFPSSIVSSCDNPPFHFEAKHRICTPEDLKSALDITIGSALRKISSGTVCIISELSMVFKEILPENLWLMADAGGVAGFQAGADADAAKHISCVFRENLTRKALNNNETLVVTGALQEIPPGSDECNTALLYN
jgi:hypothetical protein